MIAYYFPPIGGSGALRPLKLAKYLPGYGWSPFILTVRNPDWYYAFDPKLLTDLQRQAKIFRSFMLRSSWIYRIFNPLRIRKLDATIRRFFIQPDDQVGWVPFAIKLAYRITKQFKVDAIYSTSSPLSCHLIADSLHRKTKIPWIADFRDEWYENPDFNFPTSWHRRLHYRLEGRIVHNANHVITAAPVFAEFLKKHDKISNKLSTVLMGFDPMEFPRSRPVIQKRNDNNKFTLTFSGLFYKSFRPRGLLAAISNLIAEGEVESDTVRIQFVGANDLSDIGFEDRYGICEFTGFVPRGEALKYLSQADALLLLLSKERGERVIPSKTFEYLACGTPILALIPPTGDIAGIINETGGGLVVDHEDVEGIRSAFLLLYKSWKQGAKLFQPDWEKIDNFNQKNFTRKFANLLDEMS